MIHASEDGAVSNGVTEIDCSKLRVRAALSDFLNVPSSVKRKKGTLVNLNLKSSLRSKCLTSA